MVKRAVDVLRELCDTVDAAGGVLYRNGLAVPLGDPEWIDLGEIYLDACLALGRAPYPATDDEAEENEEGAIN